MLGISAAMRYSCQSTAVNDIYFVYVRGKIQWVLQEMLDRERQNANASIARERACAVAAERDAESATGQADARKRQLQHDVDNAHSEVSQHSSRLNLHRGVQDIQAGTSSSTLAWLPSP